MNFRSSYRLKACTHSKADPGGSLMNDENQNVSSLKEAYRLWHDTKAGSVDHWLNLMTCMRADGKAITDFD
jgi:hypothetical protein